MNFEDDEEMKQEEKKEKKKKILIVIFATILAILIEAIKLFAVVILAPILFLVSFFIHKE